MLVRPGKKKLSREEADAVLRIELSPRFPELTGQFLSFLAATPDVVSINHDQWVNMLDVFVMLSSGEKYDLNGACITISC